MITFYFNDVDQLYPIHYWEWENYSIINAYSIKIIYILSKKFYIKIDDLEFQDIYRFDDYFKNKFTKKDKNNSLSLTFCGLPKINSSYMLSFRKKSKRIFKSIWKSNRKSIRRSILYTKWI